MELVPDPSLKILIVEDDPAVRVLFAKLLQRRGYQVDCIAGLADLRERADETYDGVLLDLYLDDGLGIEALDELYRTMPLAKIVIVTAQATVDLAVRTMNEGVSGFLSKDEAATETVRKFEEFLQDKSTVPASPTLCQALEAFGIVGQSRPLQDVLLRIERIRNVESTVLILGESGVGKELMARAVHDSSRRKDGPFVAINCAAIPDHLLEAELFGYKKGSFTDAKADRKGFFEVCTNGTLLLDEIGEMSPNLQAKLLRVLQEREFIPIGSCQSVKVNTRVIASTNRNIENAIAQGRFREDLYYRLSVIRLDLPPLRERKDDIPALVTNFVERFNKQFNRTVRPPTGRVLARLRAYDWPGNVRELRNAVERAVIMAEGPAMQVEDLLPCQQIALKVHASGQERSTEPELPVKFADAKRDFERAYLAGILRLAGGNIAEAARLSGQYRTNIYRLINKYALDQAVYKRGL